MTWPVGPLQCGRMPDFKPAYLIHGDDHGRIAERRARLRAIAERVGGAAALEVFEGDAGAPEEVAAALGAMTFALGRRFLIVDGVERWKEAEVAPIAALLADPPPDTTVAFFAREDGRARAPKALAKAVAGAGGDVTEEKTLRAWQLPKWVGEQARGMGIELEDGAPSALVAHVGERQQRLLRELEKLALEYGTAEPIGADQIDAVAARSAERKAWTLADALVAGDRTAAVTFLLELQSQGERLESLLYQMARRVRQALEVATRLEAGESRAQVKRTLRMPSRVADRFIADVADSDPARLRAALERLADVEVASRGGPVVSSRAGGRAIVGGGLTGDTLAARAVLAITS